MKPVAKTRATVKRRPAESGGLIAAAVVTLILGIFDLHPEPQVVSALVVLVAAIPAGITWSREH